jgi:hypothetical protein
MKKIFVGELLITGLLAVGCGEKPPIIDEPQAAIIIDDINGLNPKDAKFAIFNNVTEPTDIDGDGVNDFDATSLVLIASDQEDLCGALTADPNALDNLPDIQAVQITAVRFDTLGQGIGFAEGDITANKGLFELLFGDVVAGDTVLFSGVTIRVGGVEKVQALDDGVFEVGKGVLDLKSFEPGVEVSADFTGILTQEVADEAFFDTDTDGDGINDTQTINNELKASFKNVLFCAAAGQ